MRVRTSIMVVILAAMGLGLGAHEARGQDQVSRSVLAAQDSLTLKPGDILRIQVWPDDKYGGEFTVEETGLVYLPLLGAVQTAGLPISRLRAQLRSSYATVMKTPVVTVTPVFHVGVLGDVRSPGVYPVTPTQTLLDVIGLAGGFSGNAETDNIRIVRGNHVLQIDAARALEGNAGGTSELNEITQLRLRSGDQIVVPAHHSSITFGGVMSFLGSAAAIGFLLNRIITGH